MSDVANLIAVWSGALGTIPAGWALCDGNNGTPDLRQKFVRGAQGSYGPGDEGGNSEHTHGFTSDGHAHSFGLGPGFQTGADFLIDSTTNQGSGTTDVNTPTIPWYSLAFIMRLL